MWFLWSPRLGRWTTRVSSAFPHSLSAFGPAGRLMTKSTSILKCQNEKGAWHKMSAGYFLLHNHNILIPVRTHTPTPSNMPRSWLCFCFSFRSTPTHRQTIFSATPHFTHKPQSSYFLCSSLAHTLITGLWSPDSDCFPQRSLELVNILQVWPGPLSWN